MAFGMPGAAAAGARPDVGLLDAPAVDIHIREDPAVAVVAIRSQHNLSALDQGLKAALRHTPARLIELGRVDVGESHLLAVAHQRVAVDRKATFPSRRSACRREKEEKNE